MLGSVPLFMAIPSDRRRWVSPTGNNLGDQSVNKIICENCLEVLPTLPPATMIWADPPDNLGLKYDGFTDKRPDYIQWLTGGVIRTALQHEPGVFWLSPYYRYLPNILGWFYSWRSDSPKEWQVRLFLWRFTFGQHQTKDCGNGYRPILRFSKPGFKWNTDAIRVPSARQSKYQDLRADPRGRVPDDVFEFPRICGTFKERRRYCPNQHPKALMRRIIAMSCSPGDSVIDLFAGTGSCVRACEELGIDCTSIDISPNYCQHLREELRCK